MPLEAKLRSQRLFPRAPRTTLNGFAPRYTNCGQDAATFETGPRVSRDRCARRPPTIDAMPLQIHTQPTTRTISAKRAEVHQNLSHRPSPDGTATRRWPVKCRRGHHGVQICGAGAADQGIEDERHARLQALSRSVGTADGVPGHGSVSVACQLCCQSRRELARSAHQPHTAGCLQLHSQTTGSDHHADRRTQHGPRRAPRAA
jgi:hypothetical protein